MKLHSFLFVLAISLFSQATAQQKAISLEELWSGGYATTSLEELRSMKNGKEYTVLERDPASRTSAIASYSYETLEKTATLVSANPAGSVPYFTSYAFSDDENRILLATDENRLFRHSRQAIYYVFDRRTGEITRISPAHIREPSFSPDGNYVAYVFENNIYLLDLGSGETRQLTLDGRENNIINGVTDWVYEEEFSFVRAFEWNADSSKIAFLRFDESGVPQYAMDVYGTALYPAQMLFKYPKAGEANSVVSLHLYDLPTGRLEEVPLEHPYYIPRIQWMHHPNHLSVQTLNRHQDRLQLYRVDASKNSVKVLLEERDPAYVDVTDVLTFLPDDRFIWLSERDGRDHLYLYGSDGTLMRQLTTGTWDVTSCYGYDAARERL